MTDAREPGWNDIAQWYDEYLSAGSGPHETALICALRLCGALEGRHALDLACGQGLATRALARGGCESVTGVDSSRELIERARGYETSEPLGIDYLVDDAQYLESMASERFDLVNCQLALMDIPDLDATLKAVRRVLKPGGAFVFVIGHPAFLAPFATTEVDKEGRPGRMITDYLEDRFWRSNNPSGVRRVGNYHRRISTYLNAVVSNGLDLVRIEEPPASALLVQQQPVYRSVPIFFGARARRR